jgi:hypothetical protein
MTTLADTSYRISYGRWSSPCCRPRGGPPYGGRHRTISDRGLLRRNRLHGPDLHPVAAAAYPRAGLRLTGDLLAATDLVGQRQGVPMDDSLPLLGLMQVRHLECIANPKMLLITLEQGTPTLQQRRTCQLEIKASRLLSAGFGLVGKAC